MVCLCIPYFKESIRMKRLIYLLSVIVAIFCGLPVKAASGVTIHGRVTDTEQKPIEFVTVRIGGTAIGTNTGLEGEYRLSLIVFSSDRSRLLSSENRQDRWCRSVATI